MWSASITHVRITLTACLMVTAAIVFAIWAMGTDEAEMQNQAESLLARMVPDGAISPQEHDLWQQIGDSDPPLRIAVAALLQQARYSGLLYDSVERISRSLIGLDLNATMSRLLVENLICNRLQSMPDASVDEASLYLITWLNPAALRSEQCAVVLIDTLHASAPSTLAARTQLLANVLAQLPADLARPHIDALLAHMETADAAEMDELFSALRSIDSTAFADALEASALALTRRIATAENDFDVALLFDAIDSLKYEVPTATLVPVLETAVDRMLNAASATLTRDIYFTLADLEISHPDTRYSERIDYLMRGIGIYGANIEISDFSRVWLLNEQYAGDDAMLAHALFDGIRNLSEDEYLGAIRAYCLRFLEIGAELDHELFLEGVVLLFEQLRNEQFIFQWEFLNDARLKQQLTSEDKVMLNSLIMQVVTSLTTMDALPGPTRIQHLLELIATLGQPLNEEQITTLENIATTLLQEAPVTNDSIRLASVIARSPVDFSAEFREEIFLALADIAAAPEDLDVALIRPSALFSMLAPPQQQNVVMKYLQEVLMSTGVDDAEAEEALRTTLASWVSSRNARQSIVSQLLAESGDNSNADPRAVIILQSLSRNMSTVAQAPRQITLDDIAQRTQRSDIEQGFRAIHIVRPINARSRGILHAAAFRFLNQIAPADRLDESMRSYMQQYEITLSADEVARLSSLYLQALAAPDTVWSPADYAASMETLALYGNAGELAALLHAIRHKLVAVTDADLHKRLMAAWIAVEASTNRNLAVEQRIPLFLEVLDQPTTTSESVVLVVDGLGRVTGQDFSGDIWKFAAWLQQNSVLPSAPETQTPINDRQ